MGSLKEVKNRINSVKSTRQITHNNTKKRNNKA